MNNVPVWKINITLGNETFELLTTNKQWHYDEYENYQDDEPAGYLNPTNYKTQEEV